ncbi:MAG TPA: PilN domain-containing protein [Candidatus Saccharimonadales bacterium]|nr:PilN domain-containing protein [Candidatus Saccharimonadales bacterium]
MTAKINLLPDIRQAKVRSQQQRRLAAGIGTLVCALAIGAVVVLALVLGAQKLRLGVLQNSINASQEQLAAVTDLKEMLTVQQHLAALPGLYNQRAYLTRFFDTLQAVSPTQFAVSSVEVDSQNNLEFNGSAQSYNLVSKFAQALEASNLTLGPGATLTNQPYFTNIAITSVSLDSENKVGFSLTATMAPAVISRQGGTSGVR